MPTLTMPVDGLAGAVTFVSEEHRELKPDRREADDRYDDRLEREDVDVLWRGPVTAAAGSAGGGGGEVGVMLLMVE
jgi:hypothetical protein